MDKVDKAVKTIKDFCAKFTHCEEGCRFYDAIADMCALQNADPPEEWEIREEEEY